MLTRFDIDEENENKLITYVLHHTHLVKSKSYKIPDSCTFDVMFKMSISDTLALCSLLTPFISTVLHTIIIDYMSGIKLSCQFYYFCNSTSIKFYYNSQHLYIFELNDCHFDAVQLLQLTEHRSFVMPHIEYISFGPKMYDNLQGLLFCILCDKKK